MDSEKGIVYLIQPCELVGTERYKIGCSGKNNLDRCLNYKKGTRFILICEVEKPFLIENIIKKEFSKKFKLIAGKEFFQGDEKEMTDLFYNLIKDHKNNVNFTNEYSSEENSEETSSQNGDVSLTHLHVQNTSKDDNIDNEDIYSNQDVNEDIDLDIDDNNNILDTDIYFGFNEKIVEYNTKYFQNINLSNPSLKIIIKLPENYSEDGFIIETPNKFQYFIFDRYTTYVIRDLINKSKIELNKEYDLYDKKFMNLFNKYKKNIFDNDFEKNLECYYNLMKIKNDYPFSLADEYYCTNNNILSELEKLKDVAKNNLNQLNSNFFDEKNNFGKYVSNFINDIDKMINNINELKKRKEEYDYKNTDNIEKYKESELKYFKKYKKINQIKNIIYNKFSFISVNYKYPILLVNELDENIKKSKNYLFALPDLDFNLYNDNICYISYKINN
jgi:hypothetical protein